MKKPTLIKQTIGIIIILLISIYFINNYLENKAKQEAEIIKVEKIEKKVKTAINQLVKKPMQYPIGKKN